MSARQRYCARHDSITGHAVSVNASGGVVAVGGTSGLCVFDLEWPWEPHQWLPHIGAVATLAWHPALSHAFVLASADAHGTVSLYDLMSHNPLGNSLVTRRQLSLSVDSLSWSDTSPHLVAARATGGHVTLWDTRTHSSGANDRIALGEPAPDAHSTSPETRGALCWGAGEHELISSAGGGLRLWDVRRPQAPWLEQPDAHDGGVLSVGRCRPAASPGSAAAHPSHSHFLSCGCDGVLRIWSTELSAAVEAPDVDGMQAESHPGAPVLPASPAPVAGGLVCIASAASATAVRDACCLSPSVARFKGGGAADGAGLAMVAVTVSDPPDASGGTRPVPGDAGGLHGLQTWYLDRTGQLCPAEWKAAGSVRSVACTAGATGAAGGVEATAGGVTIASVGLDKCLRLWDVAPLVGAEIVAEIVGRVPSSATEEEAAVGAGAGGANEAEIVAEIVGAGAGGANEGEIVAEIVGAGAGGANEGDGAPVSSAADVEAAAEGTRAHTAPEAGAAGSCKPSTTAPVALGEATAVASAGRSRGLAEPAAAELARRLADRWRAVQPAQPPLLHVGVDAGLARGSAKDGWELDLVCELALHGEGRAAGRAADASTAGISGGISGGTSAGTSAGISDDLRAPAAAEQTLDALLAAAAEGGLGEGGRDSPSHAEQQAAGDLPADLPPRRLGRGRSAPTVLQPMRADAAAGSSAAGAAGAGGTAGASAGSPSGQALLEGSAGDGAPAPTHIAFLRLRLPPMSSHAAPSVLVRVVGRGAGEGRGASGAGEGADGGEAGWGTSARSLLPLPAENLRQLQAELSTSLAVTHGGGGSGGGRSTLVAARGREVGRDLVGRDRRSGSRAAWAAEGDAGLVSALLECMHALLVGSQRAQASIEMARWRYQTLTGSGRAGGASRLEPIHPNAGPAVFDKASSIPPPRTSGCAFNASGMLVTFGHSPSPYAGLAEAEAPRTYDDFEGLVPWTRLRTRRAPDGARPATSPPPGRRPSR